MRAANVSRNELSTLPEELQVAQRAIELPEVKEMLKKLSGYNLGIYMPHMHDEQTGAFQPLPPGVTQVEDGLVVTFRQMKEYDDQPDRSYIPVGWFWDEAAAAVGPRGMCRTRCDPNPNGTHHPYHKPND